jgi:GTPase
MLIDDVKIKVKAGKGGDGAVAFNKTKMNKGPVGANGGRGGDVYFEGSDDLSALLQFMYRKEWAAPDGERAVNYDEGRHGEDLVIKIPVGTVAHNLTIKKDFEITKKGERVFAAKGGRGGKGNFFFKSSTNRRPREFEYGDPGEEFEFRLELKMIADIGFVGLPNVGKSSLLNRLTNAKSKVADYPFTTLNPNLGVFYELILADIPGLIEGASEGKGLGDKFLRHIERTGTLFHLISAESQDPVADYEIIRKELGDYNKDLLSKKEYVFLSKKDEVAKEEIKEKIKTLSGRGISAVPISVIDDESVKEVEKILQALIKEKKER